MFLESKNIPELQRLLDQPSADGLTKIRGADISLSVALFLAVAHRSLWQAGDADRADSIARLALPGVSKAINCLARTSTYICSEPFGAPPFDLYRINSKEDLLSDEWPLFYDRFRRSASGGRKGIVYRGVGGVLGEMGDNVISHAYERPDHPCPAIAGFFVTPDNASFCVADAGRGFLQSLRRSPTWVGLKSDQEALDAVVNKHATSRPGEREGGGFKQLFNSLLDFNGLVILRSGGCAFRMEYSGSARRLTSRESLPVPGSAVTVVISSTGKPAELPLEKRI